MSKAKRNSRQLGRGSAPVPTPILWFVDVLGASATSVAIEAKVIIEGFPYVQQDEMSATGRQSNLSIKQNGVNNFIEVTGVVLNGGGGGGVIEFEYEALDVGTYTIISQGWDPAVRGLQGQWLAPWESSFTVL